MVRRVSIEEAQTDLSRLVDEEFVIARDGRPVARVVPIRDGSPDRRIGFMTDIEVPDDFDMMGSERITGSFGVA